MITKLFFLRRMSSRAACACACICAWIAGWLAIAHMDNVVRLCLGVGGGIVTFDMGLCAGDILERGDGLRLGSFEFQRDWRRRRIRVSCKTRWRASCWSRHVPVAIHRNTHHSVVVH